MSDSELDSQRWKSPVGGSTSAQSAKANQNAMLPLPSSNPQLTNHFRFNELLLKPYYLLERSRHVSFSYFIEQGKRGCTSTSIGYWLSPPHQRHHRLGEPRKALSQPPLHNFCTRGSLVPIKHQNRVQSTVARSRHLTDLNNYTEACVSGTNKQCVNSSYHRSVFPLKARLRSWRGRGALCRKHIRIVLQPCRKLSKHLLLLLLNEYSLSRITYKTL